MPLLQITTGSWESVGSTTTARTIVQNRGGNPVYVTIEATGSFLDNEGIELGPREAVEFGSGVDIDACCASAENPTKIYYGPLE